MALFLQIIGGVVLTIVLVIVGFFLYLKIKLGKYFDEALSGGGGVPLFVQLNEDFKPEWLDKKKVSAICAELEGAGYARCNAYTVPQMAELKIASFRKDPVWVALYEHPLAGHWVDFVAHTEAGKEYTLSNSAMGEGTEVRPECEKVQEPECSAAELARRMEDLLAGGETFKPAPADFREFFESSYEKDMQFRLRHGGTTRKEFETEAAASGSKLKPEKLEEAFTELKLQELHQWSEACLQYFMKRLSEQQQESLFEDSYVFFVPHMTHPPALLSYLADMGFLDDEEAEHMQGAFPEGTEIYSMFDRVNESRSPKLRAEMVVESDAPLDHRIYRVKYDMASELAAELPI